MNEYLIGVAISLVAYIIFSLIISTKVKSANDYYVAGRNASLLLVVGSVMASSISTGLFMGEAGQAYTGMFALLVIVWRISGAGYTYGAIFFGRYLRRSEALTLPQFFSKRYQSRQIYTLAVITSVITMFVYMLSTMQAMGSLMSQITGLTYEMAIVLVFVTVAFITIFSGSRGVLITDTIMFLLFTIVMFAGVFFISRHLGGWYNGIAITAANTELPGMLDWAGSPGVFKGTTAKNIIWAISNGIVWFAVPYVSPWQTSRYLMAKDEHTVIRASVWVALFSFISMITVMMSAVFVRQINPDIPVASNVMIWAAMNLMPKAIGVVLLTGILAAGISSATTFLSLIGSSVANDILKVKDDSKLVATGRVAMLIVAMAMFLLAYYRPPQIWIIMYIGATIIACSWLPVSIAAVWIPRVTKTGAFWGMLLGFCGSFAMELLVNVGGVVLPFWMSSFFVGIGLCIAGLVIGTLLTKPTEAELAEHKIMHTMPESEKNPAEIRKSKGYAVLHIGLSVVVTIVLLALWAIPYAKLK